MFVLQGSMATSGVGVPRNLFKEQTFESAGFIKDLVKLLFEINFFFFSPKPLKGLISVRPDYS